MGRKISGRRQGDAGDGPRRLTVPALYRAFPDESACRRWLEGVRWAGRAACPRCGGEAAGRKPPASKPGHHWCGRCRKHFTVSSGTFLHGSKVPMQDWLYAVHGALAADGGVSARQLAEDLGRQPRTALRMLRRLGAAAAQAAWPTGADARPAPLPGAGRALAGSRPAGTTWPEFEDFVRRALAVPAGGLPRSENREPTAAQIDRRFSFRAGRGEGDA